MVLLPMVFVTSWCMIFLFTKELRFLEGPTMLLRYIRKAHKIHHKSQTKEHGQCFGMLLVPYKYFKAEWGK